MRRTWFFLLLALVGLLLWLACTEGGTPVDVATSPDETDSATEPSSPERVHRAARRRRAAAAPEADAEGTAAPGESTPPDLAPEGSVPWTVTVLGPGDVPAVGIEVQVDKPTRLKLRSLTDESGRAGLGAWPEEQSLGITLVGLPGEAHALVEPHTVLRVPGLIPLEIRIVDGATGADVSGARLLMVGARRDIPVTLDSSGRFLLPCSRAQPGASFEQKFRVEPPRSHALAFDGSLTVKGTISRYAERVAVDLVVRPATKLHVRVLEADGSAVQGARVRQLSVAGWAHTFQVIPSYAEGSLGVLGVRGLPYLPGEKVELTVAKDGRSAAIEPVRVPAPGTRELVTVVLPAEVGGGGSFRGRGGRRTLRAWHSGTLTAARGSGRIEAFVVRRDGSPAADTEVLIMGRKRSRTDRFGRVVFENLPARGFTLAVLEPGFLRVSADVYLEEGESRQVTLREPKGRRVTATVVDAEGAPVPFAALSVSNDTAVPFVHVEGGVQHLTLHTDAYGRCEILGLPAASVGVEARFGSRTVSGRTTARAQFTLTLPPVD